ncbi:hypothetical protein [Methylobacter sp.]|uniref:hypothetical protein n=1 Tax=Methylobacter sp. TaxID=2051955 RepID=UPI003DA552C2
MNKFKTDNDTEYLAEDFIGGYLINPFFLDGLVPDSPFIIRTQHKVSVHHLINGCLRCWGIFDTLDEALNCARYESVWMAVHLIVD